MSDCNRPLIYNEDDLLPLSGLQHISFCERQYGLIHIERAWEENELTTEGHLLHEHVHDPMYKPHKVGSAVIRSMPLKSLQLGLVGVADIVEFWPVTQGGTYLIGKKGLYQPNPVEYKRGKEKEGDFDRIQLCAQVLCLEEMYECDIVSAELYYGETRRRVTVIMDETLRNKVVQTSKRMHEVFGIGKTPPVCSEKSKCRKCSLREICLPDTLRRGSVKQYWSINLNYVKE